MSLREIARALGGDVCGGEVLAPGPGCSPRNRSMSVKLWATSPWGFVVYSFRGQRWPELRDHICTRLGIDRQFHSARLTQNERSPRVAPTAEPDRDDKRIADAVALFRESVNPTGTPAERYFLSRGLDISDLAGRVVRWNPRIGALVALFRNIHTGEPQAVSRRFLGPDAVKLGKPKFLGPAKNAAIMHDPFDAVTLGLHIGEGLETCQAARQLGLRPAWALGSSGAVAAFPVLSGVEALTLLAENDAASPKAVETCAARWHAAGREVLINKPIGGKDLNDAIRGDVA